MDDFHFSLQLVVVLPSKRWFVVVRTVRDFEITLFCMGFSARILVVRGRQCVAGIDLDVNLTVGPT